MQLFFDKCEKIILGFEQWPTGLFTESVSSRLKRYIFITYWIEFHDQTFTSDWLSTLLKTRSIFDYKKHMSSGQLFRVCYWKLYCYSESEFNIVVIERNSYIKFRYINKWQTSNRIVRRTLLCAHFTRWIYIYIYF